MPQLKVNLAQTPQGPFALAKEVPLTDDRGNMVGRAKLLRDAKGRYWLAGAKAQVSPDGKLPLMIPIKNPANFSAKAKDYPSLVPHLAPPPLRVNSPPPDKPNLHQQSKLSFKEVLANLKKTGATRKTCGGLRKNCSGPRVCS